MENNLTPGKKVIHILTNQIMIVKKNYGTVSSCVLNEEDGFLFNNRILIDTCVCNNENLKLI